MTRDELKDLARRVVRAAHEGFSTQEEFFLKSQEFLEQEFQNMLFDEVASNHLFIHHARDLFALGRGC